MLQRMPTTTQATPCYTYITDHTHRLLQHRFERPQLLPHCLHLPRRELELFKPNLIPVLGSEHLRVASAQGANMYG
jgi:hypothetical protein